MYVLGVHVGHDSGAALVRDGEVLAAVSEERFTRIKHYDGLPWRSVDYCLEAAGIQAHQVDVLAVPSRQMGSELRFLLHFDLDERQLAPNRALRVGGYAWRRLRGRLPAPSRDGALIRTPTYLRPLEMGLVDFVPVAHHLAHAASAYYASGMEGETLVVTCDGIGDGVSLAVWLGDEGRLVPLMKEGPRGSLGWFYGVVTEALGWWHGDGEGKTMGLAPYGDSEKAKGCLDPILPLYEDGRLAKGHDFGPPARWTEAGASHWHLSDAAYIQQQVAEYGKEHVAAEAQRLLEKEMLGIVRSWLGRFGTTQLACSGGVFLNVKLNQRIWDSGLVARQFIYPNAGDAGLAVGAALYGYHLRSGDTTLHPLRHAYSGPEFSNEEIERVLEVRKILGRRSEDIAAECALLLAEGAIVGWMQGRMEYGPRALGARSILMDPRRPENKDIINARVKYREPFRPFCPSLVAEALDDYLRNARADPYMITSFDVRPERWNEIPAVVHVDGTVRPQVVDRSVNEKYWRLIHRFGQITGIPVILNTSMNVKGEPIVCTPHDAVTCFFGTGMDYLAIGDWLVRK